jgi:hypothetical protein
MHAFGDERLDMPVEKLRHDVHRRLVIALRHFCQRVLDNQSYIGNRHNPKSKQSRTKVQNARVKSSS